MVLGDAGWDRKESPESNLHVCGKDDIKIIVYNMERCTKKEKDDFWELLYSLNLNKTIRKNYLSCSEDRFLMVLVSNRPETLNKKKLLKLF